jgi:hypothetical protein
MDKNMKLLLGTPIEMNGKIEQNINESNGFTQKNYYIEGPFATIETPNRNGRIYSKDLWEEQVKRYNEDTLIPLTKNIFCELEHPPRAEVDEMQAVGRIVSLDIRENYVWGKIKILNDNSPATNKLKALIDEGYKIGVSSRGVGEVVERNGIPYVERGNYHCITWDIVGAPSDRAANLNGIYESLEKNSKNYQVDPSTNEIQEIELCSLDNKTCSKFPQQDVEEGILKKVQDLFASFTKTQSEDGVEGEGVEEVKDTKGIVIKKDDELKTIVKK